MSVCSPAYFCQLTRAAARSVDLHLCVTLAEQLQINYKRIAQLFGQGTTGNAIDCNFRKYRAAAKRIKEELDTGITQPPPPTTPRKPKTPKKDALSGKSNFITSSMQC